MRKNLAVLGVVGFILVDVLLVVLALRHAQGDASAADDGARRPSASATVKASPSATPTQGKPTSNQGGKRERKDAVLLSISDDGTVVRGVRGSCEADSTAKVEISSDSGASFDTVTPELTQVLSVEASSDAEISVVGADQDCEPRRFRSSDLGETWKKGKAPEDWYLLPGAKKSVRSPIDTTRPGCTVLALAEVDVSVARVACTDSSIRGTGDAGAEWVRLGSLKRLRAITYAGPSRAVALAESDDCAGQVFTTTNGGSKWSRGGCIDGELAEAVAANDRIILAQVSGQVFRSTDDGETWSKA